MWICRLAKRSILADGEEVIRNRKLPVLELKMRLGEDTKSLLLEDKRAKNVWTILRRRRNSK